MGALCSNSKSNCCSSATIDSAPSKVQPKPQPSKQIPKKMVAYSGEKFKGDEGARLAAEAWCSDSSNSDWVYTGKYTITGGESDYSYFFEVQQSAIKPRIVSKELPEQTPSIAQSTPEKLTFSPNKPETEYPSTKKCTYYEDPMMDLGKRHSQITIPDVLKDEVEKSI